MARSKSFAAKLESMDPDLLAPDPATPGRFVAKGLGGTQVRAVLDVGEAFADVTISGKRFLAVNTKLDEGENDFSVAIDVSRTPPKDRWNIGFMPRTKHRPKTGFLRRNRRARRGRSIWPAHPCLTAARRNVII